MNETSEIEIQPSSYLLELSFDWIVLRASENIHGFLGEYAARLIGEPLSSFTRAQPLHDLRNMFARQNGGGRLARAYRMRLVDDRRHFDLVFQLSEGRILLEAIASNDDDNYGMALGSVAPLIDGLAGLRGQALLEGATRRMRALSGFDRAILQLRSGERAASSRSTFAERPQQHGCSYLPALICDTQAAGIPLFPRNGGSSAAQHALLRCPTGTEAEMFAHEDIRAVWNLPLAVDGETVGCFECDNRRAVRPSLEMHAAAELFAQVVAMKLG